MLVVDASVLAVALADDGPYGRRARERLDADSLVAPELIDVETASVFRGLSLAGKLPASRAKSALTDLLEIPIERVAHRPLLARCWELRSNLTVYDATYVALAELLDVVLVTADARLSRAPGLRCTVDVLTA